MGVILELKDRKIGLKVLTQKIDTSTPEGTLFFHMNAAFDQFQREIIVENTKAGLKLARENGRIGGRPSVMSEEKLRNIRAMLKDEASYPFIADVIKASKVGRTTFYRHYSARGNTKIQASNKNGVCIIMLLEKIRRYDNYSNYYLM